MTNPLPRDAYRIEYKPGVIRLILLDAVDFVDGDTLHIECKFKFVGDPASVDKVEFVWLKKDEGEHQ